MVSFLLDLVEISLANDKELIRSLESPPLTRRLVRESVIHMENSNKSTFSAENAVYVLVTICI